MGFGCRNSGFNIVVSLVVSFVEINLTDLLTLGRRLGRGRID